MAATWHPSDGFEPLATRLFIGASYASAACYTMDNRDIIDIVLCVIKCCGMYAKEYKNWISCKRATSPFVKTIDSFKEYWANAIALVNQMAVLASQHGYGLIAVDNNELLALNGDSIANFGAAYATTHETMKSQADSLVAMLGQLANIQNFCMAVSQQPPSSIYAPAQQQRTFNNCNKHNSGGQSSAVVSHNNQQLVLAVWAAANSRH
jgi:hypothetical protein